jgi:predicted ATPase
MRISLSGPAEAGKTTLFEELKKHLAKEDYSFYPEIARTLINIEPEIFSDKKSFEERLFEIHKTREHERLKRQNAVFDRCIWDCFVYSDYYGFPLNKNEAEETLNSCIDVIFVFPQISRPSDEKIMNLYLKHSQKIQNAGQTVYFVNFFNLRAKVDFILDVLYSMPVNCNYI